QSDAIDLFERRDLSLRQPGTHPFTAWVGQKTGMGFGIHIDPGEECFNSRPTHPPIGSSRPPGTPGAPDRSASECQSSLQSATWGDFIIATAGALGPIQRGAFA